MHFSFSQSGGPSPFARRLKCLLLTAATIAMSQSAVCAQSVKADNEIATTRHVEKNTDDTELFINENLRASALGKLPDEHQPRAQRENFPQAAEQGRTSTYEAKPFAPIGLRAGSFMLRPSLEQGMRATSNGDNSANGSSAILSETTLRVNAQSDWSRHQLAIDASGTLSKSISGEDVSEPRLDIQGDLRLDLSNEIKINAGTGYRLRRESASSPNSVTDALKRPLVHSYNGSLALERDTGRLFGRITGRVQHDMYGNAELQSGGTVSQKDRNNTFASLALRGGFSVSSALRPFAEVEFGKREFNERYDSNGYERSGSQYAIRGGLMFDRGEKFNGEIAAGFTQFNSDDFRLKNISGPSIAARIHWSPLRGTDLDLYAQTLIDTSTTAGVTGSLMQLASLQLTHDIRSNLSLHGKLDTLIRQNKDGTGTDYTIGAEIGTTYWLNRFVGVDTRLRHEFLRSQVEAREYTSNSVYVGLRLQR